MGTRGRDELFGCSLGLQLAITLLGCYEFAQSELLRVIIVLGE